MTEKQIIYKLYDLYVELCHRNLKEVQFTFNDFFDIDAELLKKVVQPDIPKKIECPYCREKMQLFCEFYKCTNTNCEESETQHIKQISEENTKQIDQDSYDAGYADGFRSGSSGI